MREARRAGMSWMSFSLGEVRTRLLDGGTDADDLVGGSVERAGEVLGRSGFFYLCQGIGLPSEVTEETR